MADNRIEITSVKIGLLGDSSVGKTAICYNFNGIEFADDHLSTIGVDKIEKKMTLKLVKILN